MYNDERLLAKPMTLASKKTTTATWEWEYSLKYAPCATRRIHWFRRPKAPRSWLGPANSVIVSSSAGRNNRETTTKVWLVVSDGCQLLDVSQLTNSTNFYLLTQYKSQNSVYTEDRGSSQSSRITFRHANKPVMFSRASSKQHWHRMLGCHDRETTTKVWLGAQRRVPNTVLDRLTTRKPRPIYMSQN